MAWPEYRGLGWLEAVHPDDRSAITPRAPPPNQLLHMADARIHDQRSDDWRWFRIRALPIYSEGETVDRHSGLARRQSGQGRLPPLRFAQVCAIDQEIKAEVRHGPFPRWGLGHQTMMRRAGPEVFSPFDIPWEPVSHLSP